MRNLLTVAVVGAAIAVAGVFIAPEKAWANLLLATYFVLGLCLAGVVFIAIQNVSNAGWSVALRRIPEAMTSVLPYAGGLMIVLMLGIPSLYEWSHADVVATDPILQSKSGWLNTPFFIARTVVYLTVWLALAHLIVRASQRQDENGDLSYTHRAKRYSAIFLVVFALTFTLASFDWIMSLEPHWYSTIFGVYNFAGMFLSGLAMITLLAILLKRWGPLQHILTAEHLHSLGKLTFGFSTFWMYLWFSQYMLIWYANIPEEVSYFVNREQGSWLIFTIINVVFNWVIPFVVLMPSWTKKHEGTMFKIAIVILIGRWIDLFWMILPPFMKADPVVSVWEFGPVVAAISTFFYLVYRALSRRSVVPVRDPYLFESLGHQ